MDKTHDYTNSQFATEVHHQSTAIFSNCSLGTQYGDMHLLSHEAQGYMLCAGCRKEADIAIFVDNSVFTSLRTIF